MIQPHCFYLYLLDFQFKVSLLTVFRLGVLVNTGVFDKVLRDGISWVVVEVLVSFLIAGCFVQIALEFIVIGRRGTVNGVGLKLFLSTFVDVSWGKPHFLRLAISIQVCRRLIFMFKWSELNIQLSFFLLKFLDFPLNLGDFIIEFLSAFEGISVIVVSKCRSFEGIYLTSWSWSLQQLVFCLTFQDGWSSIYLLILFGWSGDGVVLHVGVQTIDWVVSVLWSLIVQRRSCYAWLVLEFIFLSDWSFMWLLGRFNCWSWIKRSVFSNKVRVSLQMTFIRVLYLRSFPAFNSKECWLFVIRGSLLSRQVIADLGILLIFTERVENMLDLRRNLINSVNPRSILFVTMFAEPDTASSIDRALQIVVIVHHGFLHPSHLVHNDLFLLSILIQIWLILVFFLAWSAEISAPEEVSPIVIIFECTLFQSVDSEGFLERVTPEVRSGSGWIDILIVFPIGFTSCLYLPTLLKALNPLSPWWGIILPFDLLNPRERIVTFQFRVAVKVIEITALADGEGFLACDVGETIIFHVYN